MKGKRGADRFIFKYEISKWLRFCNIKEINFNGGEKLLL